jgi:hypothetical protein
MQNSRKQRKSFVYMKNSILYSANILSRLALTVVTLAFTTNRTMSSQRVGKIVSTSVQNRRQTPLISWIRSKLLGVDRSPETKPPGLPDADGNVSTRFLTFIYSF